MKKPLVTLLEVRQLHQAGRLEEAKLGYETLLSQDPKASEVLHLFGLLLVELDDLDSATDYLEQAIVADPENPTAKLHLANVLKAKGLFAQAAALLEKITLEHPRFAAGFNNLGVVYYGQAKLSLAIQAFQAAIAIQSNYVDAYYNLGLALQKSNKNEEAFNAYQALLELAPQHVGARFQRGCLFMLQSKYKEALADFSELEKAHPYHFETQVNLASCYLKLGLLNEAKSHYLKALDISPLDAQVLFNLGVINIQEGRLQEALGYYLQTVKIDPDSFDAHNNIGIAYLFKKDRVQALLHFQEAARIQPDNEAIRHTIRILKGENTLSASPPEYVRALFDSYADHYEPHLVEVLHYQVPALMHKAITEVRNVKNAEWDILDLGCGTGLSGQAFKELARSLVGVDLSEKMLAQAEQKHIYDALVAGDIHAYLTDKRDAYDLVVAADVLIYFGDLQPIFAGVRAALKPRGLFVFNLEISRDDAYTMTESGRFAHSEKYIHELAEANSWRILSQQVVSLRVQNGIEVPGYLLVLERSQ